MPRTVAIIVNCDIHPDRPAADGHEDVISYNKKQGAVDLCTECKEAVDAMLLPLLKVSHKIHPKSPGPKAKIATVDAASGKATITEPVGEGYPCPDCDKVSPTPQGLGAHRRTHGYKAKPKAKITPKAKTTRPYKPRGKAAAK